MRDPKRLDAFYNELSKFTKNIFLIGVLDNF